MSVRCAICVLALCAAMAAAGTPGIRLETEHAVYLVGTNGLNQSFIDKATGRNYLAEPGKRPFAKVKKDGAWHMPTACSHADGRITVQFAKPGVTVVFKATCKKRYFVFEVEKVSDPATEELRLTDLAVVPCPVVNRMSSMAADERFAVCVRALNLQTQVWLGGSPSTFSSMCFRTYGLVGARVAVVGCPRAQVRSVLQEVVRAEGLPWSPLGGPFALDAEENRGSYLFAHASEATIDEWIAMARKAGMAAVHLNGWAQSLGHYQPRTKSFPNGLAGLKACVDKIHAAGMKAGMHTLTGCISAHDPWVTPVPDKRLAVDATYALAAPIDAKATTVLTAEKPGKFDTIWAYGGRGNVVRIDDELIQFAGLSHEPPYGFTKCTRGAFRTKAAPHAKGAAAGHLHVRYTSFQPDESSTLVDDVAAQIANVFNTCGFDMIYMDGAEGMAGGWHGVATMRAAIFKKLKRRALVEASSWGTPSWVFHSRIGAWDHPKWALKRFIDIHCRSNESYRASSLLPAELGWWAILGPTHDHRAETRDEIEYLCCKALALDAPMSFQSLRPGSRPPNARQDEYLELIGRYERLRLSGAVPKAIRATLRKERDEFRLTQTPDGGWQLVPTDYAEHKVTALDDGTASWTVANRFAAQPARLRIEALYAVEPYDSKDAMVLADFAKGEEFADKAAAKGVTHSLVASQEQVKAGGVSGRLSAKNAGKTRRGAWARAGKTFEPHANLTRHGAMGLWVHGDGKGALLNVQLSCPRQYWRCWGEHYVKVDFTGWRYVELLLRERDAETFGDYKWPYAGHYAVYRSPLIRAHVSVLNLYLNHLPPGEAATCHLSPIKALRTRKVKLHHPRVTIGGKAITFPVDLESGASIEFESMTNCTLRDARGAVVQQVVPQGAAPALAAGDNAVAFACEGPAGYRARAQVTVISQGERLQGSEPKDRTR